MAESEDPKEELEFYFKLASPLALSLPDADEKARAAAWLQRLGQPEAGSPRMRADYLRLLVFALQRRRLVGVFAAPPDTSQPLQPFQGGASLSEMMRRLGTQAAAERGAGDRPAVCSMLSHDLKHFLAVQPLPHDRGAHCYMALSPDSYPNWAAKPSDSRRRRSAPGQLQQCACAPDAPPPPCSPAAATPPPRSPCECAPPAAPARVCAPAEPSPRTCACAPDQICWCPRDADGAVASPSPGYKSSSLDLDSDSDPMVFSWMSRADTSAAAQDAALRALTDAVNDSSVRFPALWQSEESGFEPMEWDSYMQANYRPGRVGEYGGGRVFTTASRMEVRRSEERLADGSVLALEERTAAGAATRVSPPAPGTCPASPPRGASAAVGATERRVTWSPPPATSSPCECVSPSRRRLALPCSPPSPISAPCRRSRTRSPPCSIMPDSLNMSPDSLEASRSRRRSSRRSSRPLRRSYSAESIVPCPASGNQLDSVTPPSGLRFSGSAGLSPCPCDETSTGIDSMTPPSGLFFSPCPSSRNETSTGIDSVTPPSGLYFSPCPSSRNETSTGIDSMTPPSGLYFSPCRSSRNETSTGIDSVTPPSGLYFSPCPCSRSGSRTAATPPSGVYLCPCSCSPKRRSSTPSPAPCSPAPCAPPPCSPEPYANVRPPRRFFGSPKGRRSSTPPPCAPARRSPSPCAPPRRSPSPCAPAPCLPPPCSPDPYANIQRPKRFFESRGRRSSTPPPPCSPARRSPSPCAPPRRSPSPCAPAPCLPPPCSPDPYANIPQPKRFFDLKGSRPSSPPCAPSPCSPAPCAPEPCLPSPCTPDPYANIPRPKRFFSPLLELAKSASLQYDSDPFYGLGEGEGMDSPSYALPSPCQIPTPCPCPPSPSPTPCPPRLRGSVPRGFYKLAGDAATPTSTPRRTGGRASPPRFFPRRVCGPLKLVPRPQPTPPPPSPAPCPATTTCEVECTPGGVVRRSFSRDCAGSTPDGQGPVSKVSSASFAVASSTPNPNPEDLVPEPYYPMPPMWEDLDDDSRNDIRNVPLEGRFDFLDAGQNRFEYPPDDTFYEFENMPCPAAESTRLFPNTSFCSSSSRSSSPAVCPSRPPSPAVCPSRPPSPAVCPGRAPSPQFYQAPVPIPQARWMDPGPMWEMMMPWEEAVARRPELAEDPFWFLDEPVPSFSYPPIHPRRKR